MALRDERIKKEVVDHLFWDSRVDASEIHVAVTHGKVTLTGTVPSYLAQQAAHECASSVLGVVTVHSRLTIRSQPQDFTSDESKATHLANVLLWSRHIDETNLECSVTNGAITLTGFVDTYWKKRKIEETCWDMRGTTSVINKLSVVPQHNIADQLIAEDIVNALSRNSQINVNEIDVLVVDGTVVLTGVARNWSALTAAQHIAEHTRGVAHVENNLVITFATGDATE
jgi:osmotically-inducible protein OsmY